jgi:hypothetical protein
MGFLGSAENMVKYTYTFYSNIKIFHFLATFFYLNKIYPISPK